MAVRSATERRCKPNRRSEKHREHVIEAIMQAAPREGNEVPSKYMLDRCLKRVNLN